MARIVLHAGFHKTGTSTAQAFLQENAGRLPPGWRYLPKSTPGYGALRAICRDRGAAMTEVSGAMAGLVAEQALGADDVLILSTEDFCGRIPGKSPAAPLYQRAPALAKALVQGCAGHQVTLLYTVRGRDAWIRSWHGHLMMWRNRVAPLEALLRNEWVASFTFEEVLRKISAAADAPVTTLALEDHAGARLGIGGAILSAAGLGDEALAGMHPVSVKNRGAPEWVQRAAQMLPPRLLPAKSRASLKKFLLRMGNAVRR